MAKSQQRDGGSKGSQQPLWANQRSRLRKDQRQRRLTLATDSNEPSMAAASLAVLVEEAEEEEEEGEEATAEPGDGSAETIHAEVVHAERASSDEGEPATVSPPRRMAKKPKRMVSARQQPTDNRESNDSEKPLWAMQRNRLRKDQRQRRLTLATDSNESSMAAASLAVLADGAPEPAEGVSSASAEQPKAAKARVSAPAQRRTAPPRPASVEWGAAGKAWREAGGSTFSAEQLRTGCPDGVERTRKEEYLDAESFAAEFGCTTEEFAAMPAWRQQAAKKRVGLY